MNRYYYGWNIVAYVFLSQIFCAGIAFYGFGILVNPWRQDFEADVDSLSMVPIAFQIAIFCISPFIGHMVDRISARTCFLIGVVVTIAALFLMSATTQLWILILVYGGMLAVSETMGGTLAAQTYTAKWFHSRRGLALALTAAGSGMGGLLLPPILQTMFDIYGWRSSLQYMAIFMAVLLIPLTVVLRDPPNTVDPRAHVAADPKATAVIDRLTTKHILSDGIFLSITTGLGVLMAIQLLFMYYLPTFAIDNGVDPSAAAILLSILAGSGIASKPFWGFVIDRVQPRLIFISISCIYLVASTIVAGIFGHVGLLTLGIGATLAGVCSGSVQALLGVVLADRFGAANFGKARGCATPILNVCAIGPLIIAGSYRFAGNYVPGLLTLMVIVAVSMVAVGYIMARQQRSGPLVTS